jgi:hypothetical protein
MSDSLRPGLSPADAVDAFEAACNHSANVLFITESWFAPFKRRLLIALPPALTEALVDALRDALYKRRKLETVVEFIEQQPMTWEQFAAWRVEREKAARLRRAEIGFFPWDDVIAAEQDKALQRAHTAMWEGVPLQDPQDDPDAACPRCRGPLTAIYFVSPARTWEQLCGRAGWLFVCKPCHLQVDFFMEYMN